MSEFPPQDPMIMQEAMIQPEAPVVVNYANLRDAYRALQNGTADRDTLIGLGDEIEANALRETDENGNTRVSLRGSVIRDEQGKAVPGKDGQEQHAKIPKAISSAVFEASKAARENADPSAWSKAAKVNEIRDLSFSQTRALIQSLNQGASLEKAYTTASEAPKETPEPETKVEAANEEGKQSKGDDKETQAHANPVDEALRQLKKPESSTKLAEAVANLDDKQLESVVNKLSGELSESLGATSAESIAQIDPIVAAKGLDEYIGKHTLPGADDTVKRLHLAAVRSFLNNIAETAPDTLQAIVLESESSLVREYKSDETQSTTVETRREIVAPQAGDVAVRKQLQKGQGGFDPNDYDLAA